LTRQKKKKKKYHILMNKLRKFFTCATIVAVVLAIVPILSACGSKDVDLDNYVSKDEYKKLQDRIEQLEGLLEENGIELPPPPASDVVSWASIKSRIVATANFGIITKAPNYEAKGLYNNGVFFAYNGNALDKVVVSGNPSKDYWKKGNGSWVYSTEPADPNFAFTSATYMIDLYFGGASTATPVGNVYTFNANIQTGSSEFQNVTVKLTTRADGFDAEFTLATYGKNEYSLTFGTGSFATVANMPTEVKNATLQS